MKTFSANGLGPGGTDPVLGNTVPDSNLILEIAGGPGVAAAVAAGAYAVPVLGAVAIVTVAALVVDHVLFGNGNVKVSGLTTANGTGATAIAPDADLVAGVKLTLDSPDMVPIDSGPMVPGNTVAADQATAAVTAANNANAAAAAANAFTAAYANLFSGHPQPDPQSALQGLKSASAALGAAAAVAGGIWAPLTATVGLYPTALAYIASHPETLVGTAVPSFGFAILGSVGLDLATTGVPSFTQLALDSVPDDVPPGFVDIEDIEINVPGLPF